MDTFSVGKFMKLPLITLALCLTAGLTAAQVGGGKSTGQSLYLPIYSHIWHGDTNSHGKLAKTLVSVSISIRNTDQRQTVRIVSATYFDTDGKKLREYLQAPKIIGPMGTYGNPPDRPKAPEVEFSKKEVLHEEVEIYRQPDHGCIETC
jgi:hypothetical protein